MAIEPTNFLVVMSDEHTRNILGCYGNSHVKTPNMDRLAARGTLFKNAYTPCPICVPCRASFATDDADASVCCGPIEANIEIATKSTMCGFIASSWRRA
jgi:arylsulfatase A-like enzyme